MARPDVFHGMQLRRLMDEPGFDAALKSVRASIIDKWISSNDAQERESLWRSIDNLEALECALRAYAANGQFEMAKEAT